MGIFDKSREELESENRILRELLKHKAKNADTKSKRQVMYQCRYCGYKSIRNATDGAPLTTAHCPKHPNGWCKGVHSWMRTYL